ncbi:bifunctional 4-hydroxy-2-oxoglutarate aldolase/2-dehydro-3-deoxy-phosphogluconate aldolase [Belliella kenyensis]|uniref:Bifunctional 4-hydroxy-2-oxoglutarate aldolase/2-dehydro-3-deoxy-phosphogluconate aldolase n=1 Tax=Belliella kenyensis TaxID=1472724 RepID=A0ABV8EJG9_9BACT|nr:bifunctional 4-hydroxy-2-oxoglutarate aldolase/2-dehydro-3-deoxy-phosphogluconate aldolase [Belliella kenyensis]MCH7403544.1 bifunctional 4-hydroxy-2-oxoglutarate aldolase/2-dehydro-3-deoxy-phosphogluconate aldolase [Belliella kenyensis]MDN3604934.1 bifunctional 4-hydroxy-2-oxoglutarate aldolase/2-dehydro-3-deoxy-phosphogluconate aldolase [Belliella kenyensis]
MNQQKNILQAMQETGMIPVFNHPDIEVAKSVLKSAYEAGVRVFEFTNRETNAFEVFKALKIYSESFEGLYLGIGTIFTVKDAQQFLFAGADFIVSPALIPEVIHYCNMKSVLWIPGCATISEVFQAKTLGAQLVKAFPGNLIGAGFVKAVKSVMPDVNIMPTGGVEPSSDNLITWFDAGVYCVGMGSQLFEKQVISSGQYQVLEEKISATLTLIRKIRS